MKKLNFLLLILILILIGTACEMDGPDIIEPEESSPVITNITVKPDTIIAGNDVTISATVTDSDGDLQSVLLTVNSIEKNMTNNGDIYTATISSVDTITYSYFISAKDGANNTSTSNTQTFKAGSPPVIEIVNVMINEFLASNDSFLDEHGNSGDWIEIYNPNNQPVNIGGYYISDDPADPVAYEIPTTNPDSTTIPAKGYIVLWADKMPEKGILHVGIKLSGSGESVVLSKPDESLVDSYTYEAQTTDISEGRETDGAETWVKFNTPTPGASNN